MIQKVLDESLEFAREHIQGAEVASYIPELARADPQQLGASVMTMQGQCFSAGHWQQRFTIQSIAKPITLILALELAGEKEVLQLLLNRYAKHHL